MLNKKVIVLSGFARGGTSIAWNVLQSHPDIVAARYETGALFKKSRLLHLFNSSRSFGRSAIGFRVVDYLLFRSKMESLRNPDSHRAGTAIPSTRKQVKQAALCLKSVNEDVLLTDLLTSIYPDLYFIALARNGYALADGYVRRGKTAGQAGRLYYRVSKEMKRYADLIPRFKMIRFEDILRRPFDVAEDLFAFAEVHPRHLERLRLKSKRVIGNEGEHSVAFGTENRKYWFDRNSISQLLDPNVNQRQIDRLSSAMIDEFNREAGSALEFFGYEKL